MWQVLLFLFLDSLNHNWEQLETTLEKNPQLIFNMLQLYVNRGKSTSSNNSWCRFKWHFFLLFDDSWSATFLNSWNPWISPFLMLASSCNVNYFINTKTITAKTNIKNQWSKLGFLSSSISHLVKMVYLFIVQLEWLECDTWKSTFIYKSQRLNLYLEPNLWD